MNKIIDIKIEQKKYNKKAIPLLKGFNLEVFQGEKIAIMGESGIGKSTLLNILGLIDNRFDGQYIIFGKKASNLSDIEKAKIRNKNIGFVLQESALIDSLNIEDNIKLSLVYADKTTVSAVLNDFDKLINFIGISNILKKKPIKCSGGERARAAFARGILMKPDIILADEPTSSLDLDNREKIINMLFNLNQRNNTTIITVTHDEDIAQKFDRIIYLKK